MAQEQQPLVQETVFLAMRILVWVTVPVVEQQNPAWWGQADNKGNEGNTRPSG